MAEIQLVSPSELVFLKLGGSLITDKTRESTPLLDRLRVLAAAIRRGLEARPDLRLLLGHGSGSFGHFSGRRYGTRRGVRTWDQWVGLSQVSAAAARLNRLVTDALLKAGIPVLSLQPSASASCHDGVLQTMAVDPIRIALERGLVPLIYGDVAIDSQRGGTIVSTEDLFSYLAPLLRPKRILLIGDVPGVLDSGGQVMPNIRPDEIEAISAQLGGSHGVDVTGGMLSKVAAMADLVISQPALSVRILSGLEPDTVEAVLTDPQYPAGTLIAS